MADARQHRGTGLQRSLLEAFLCALVLACLSACLWAADDETWAARQKPFTYDTSLPLQAQEDLAQDSGAFTTQVVHFNSVNEETVPAMVCRPKHIDKPPVVLFLHGLGGSKNETRAVATLLVPQGLAVVGIDAQDHGERKKPGTEILSGDLAHSRQAIIQTVIDNRRAVDYIRSRPDLDGNRIGLLGISMGAILGSIVAGVEPRIERACLVVGGGRWDLILTQSGHEIGKRLRDQGLTPEGVVGAIGDIDPVNFIGHIAPRPVIMINGKNDEIVPRAATEALYEAAQMPKEIHWIDGGHLLPLPPTLPIVVGWAKTL